MIINLTRKDETKRVRKIYNEKREVKLRRVQNHNQKIKDLMQKQKLDQIRGSTYESGVALKGLLPTEVQKKDAEMKEKGKVICKHPGCYVKGHKSLRIKKCKYNHCTDEDNLHDEIDREMRRLFPESYGELFFFFYFS